MKKIISFLLAGLISIPEALYALNYVELISSKFLLAATIGFIITGLAFGYLVYSILSEDQAILNRGQIAILAYCAIGIGLIAYKGIINGPVPCDSMAFGYRMQAVLLVLASIIAFKQWQKNGGKNRPWVAPIAVLISFLLLQSMYLSGRTTIYEQSVAVSSKYVPYTENPKCDSIFLKLLTNIR